MTGSLSVLAVKLLLTACGTTMMSQETWVAEMKRAYPPGTPEADVEASVTAVGMTMNDAPNVFRRLPRSVTGDGSGYWQRINKQESAPGCNMQRTLFVRFDDQGDLITAHPGDAFCT